MTIQEAARMLRSMYDEGHSKREAKTFIHLFGLRHAKALQGLSYKEVAARAGVPESYATEIYSGVKLARYAQEKI